MITDLVQQVKIKPPYFHDAQLYLYRDWEIEKFFLDKEDYLMSESIDVSRVIGHSQGYGEMTWGYMIHNLKRIEARLKEVAHNPGYYLNDQEKTDWSFIEVDDQLFLSSGKHRTTVLRYLAHYNPSEFPEGPIARKVKVTKRYLDHETMELVGTINRLVQQYPHLCFRYVGKHLSEHRWQLLNQTQNSGWVVTHGQLGELNDDLSTTSALKRLLGRGYQACFRRSIWTGLGPSFD